ncbi:hypothetical protein NCC49_000943 [Naganishia albida]|nr:hypothetical protein NCC49_000943 [Naganishia albida]
METPVSSHPPSEDEGIANDQQDAPVGIEQGELSLGEQPTAATRAGADRGQRRGPFAGGHGQGKNQIVPIDQEAMQRWDMEIGDVLADTVATSTVILPGPLPVGTNAAQAPKQEQAK